MHTVRVTVTQTLATPDLRIFPDEIFRRPRGLCVGSFAFAHGKRPKSRRV
jgi:hypothetical protein